MLSRKYGFLLFLLSFVEPTYANNKPPDLNASVIYVPTINVTPDEQIKSYPEAENIKLLVSKEGFIKEVYFAKGTPNHVKIKIEQSMKQAINFYILSEEDYRGH